MGRTMTTTHGRFSDGSQMQGMRIPFNRPWQSGQEVEYIAESIKSGHLSGDGPFTRRCENALREGFDYKNVLLTTSCTDALEMCALLLDLRPGDEVIVPSFTFVSTANAFLLHGASLVFADVDPSTLNVDPTHVASLITDRTRAVVVVHYAGVSCEMDELVALTERYGVILIEDNAHGIGGSYRTKQLGTFGQLATLSFHETKNFTCGEGGALILGDGDFVDRAEILREKGTDRSRFFRGQVDKYGWVDVGSSFLMADVLAAHLLAQLEAKTVIQARRESIWHRYRDTLSEWAALQGVHLPCVPRDRRQSFHMFYMLMPSSSARSLLIDRLRHKGILAVFHYQPLHLSPMGRSLGFGEGDCPVTENVADRLVRLPFYTGLAPSEQDEVI